MRNKFYLLWLLSLACFSAIAQQNYKPDKENLAAREKFQDYKFGIFIHWGLYSMMADGEWIMHNRNLNHLEYRKLAAGFYPSRFNADEWVKAVKEAGAKYICFTTRHHEGFSMFNTQYSDYNIVKATPFKRDVLKELADACKKYNIDLHLYYSHLDWDRDDYYPLGLTGQGTGRTTHGEWKTYYEFMNNQLRELLTKYGKIGAIWFDGWWDHDIHPNFDWELDNQYAMIHQLQPACLIGNNHHQKPFDGEDFQMFERDLPGQNTAGLSGQQISKLPLETCETMNGMWGYKMRDTSYKEVKELIHYLVKAAGNNANLLLNIGPQPNGEFPDKAMLRLKQIGEWTKKFGSTIYGTRGGFIAPRDWGVTTQRDNILFVHILNLKDKGLYLPLQGRKILKCQTFIEKKTINFSQDKDGAFLILPNVADDIDYVLELEIK